MTPLDLQIQGSDDDLLEIATFLNERGAETERTAVALNAMDAGSVDILLVAAGSGLTLASQALVAYMRRKTGQRKVVVQWLDEKEERLKRVEVESPRLEEIEPLLQKAERVFVIDSEPKKPNQAMQPTPGRRTLSFP